MFRLCVFLAFLVTDTLLIAFNISIELSTGQVIHLNVSKSDVDIDYVSIDATIEDPHELQSFIEDRNILKLMHQSAKEKWDCFLWSSYDIRPIRLPGEVFASFDPQNPPFKLEVFDPKPKTSINCGTFNCGSVQVEASPFIPTGSIVVSFTNDGSLLSNQTTDQPSDTVESEITIPEGSTISENLPEIDEEANSNVPLEVSSTESVSTSDEPPIFNLFFPTKGFDLGGRWRIAPYELRFIRQKGGLSNRESIDGNDIEVMILVIAPGKYACYQKRYNSSEFIPMTETSNVLTKNPDGDYVLDTSSGRVCVFNKQGQLVSSIDENGIRSSYQYCNGNLTHAQQADHKSLSFSYKDAKLIEIDGPFEKIYLEYNSENLLCTIYNDQGSVLYLSYNDKYLDEIIDISGNVFFDSSETKKVMHESIKHDEMPLFFSGDGEIFCYSDSANGMKISYRSWDSQISHEE